MCAESTHFAALSSLDDTIWRSRRAVQDSLSLAKRNLERRQELEQRLQAFMRSPQGDRQSEDAGRREVGSQMDASEDQHYIKEIESLRDELAQEREWRSHFHDLERVLTERMTEQESRIAFLEARLREKSPGKLDSTIPQDSVSRSNSKATSRDFQSRTSKTSRDLEDSLASIRSRAMKIDELEFSLRKSSQKYEEMKQRAAAPVGNAEQYHRGEGRFDSQLEMRSFDAYCSPIRTKHRRRKPKRPSKSSRKS